MNQGLSLNLCVKFKDFNCGIIDQVALNLCGDSASCMAQSNEEMMSVSLEQVVNGKLITYLFMVQTLRLELLFGKDIRRFETGESRVFASHSLPHGPRLQKAC